MMEIVYSVLSNMVATGNVAGITEKMNLWYYLILIK